MTNTDDFVKRVLDAIETAEEAAKPTGLLEGFGPFTRYDELRRCAADRRVIERHAVFHSVDLGGDEKWCTHCRSSRWPCPDLLDRAEAYGVSTSQDNASPETADHRGVVYQNEDTAIVVPGGADEDKALVDAAYAVTPFKDGCPNTPNCGHAGFIHDVYDEEDRMPMCGFVDGCSCGKPPAGWERTNQYWKRGDAIPAGVYVQALDGTIHQATEAWENTDFEWLVEIEEIGSAQAPASNI